ncbi:NAD(P)-dependent oxidoreductase [Methylocapsa acidiphila]|uniref:NAD(P)-dependent oxidoreductase n=1 Tax=Methylocapsa acidiphila TaxID=133552 RepID=UPI0006889C7E|nr:NAD(P)-dependent oxidoreductase [Methylocapsa acidiphila]
MSEPRQAPHDLEASSSPVIVNQGGAQLAARLEAHWSKPRVISPPKGAPPWDIPPDADMLVTQPGPWLAARAPASAPPGWPFNLRFIQALSTGVDSFPRWMLEGPPLSCARGVAATPIAEFVMAAMLNFEKDFAGLRVRQRDQWKSRPLGLLAGRTLAIAGYGAIGRAIAARGRPFGMRLIALRRSDGPLDPDVARAPDFATLTAEADHLVLSLPLTTQTHRLLNTSVLAGAKSNLHVVNVARGQLIDQEALLAALDEGRIAGATLDVTDPEPPPEGHPFYAHPKIWLTPHISWGDAKSGERAAAKALANLDHYARGEALEDLVEPALGY